MSSTKADQFAILDHFAVCIFNNQHAKASETPSVNDTEEITENSGDENSIVALIRMCGSQLQRIYKNKKKEEKLLQQSCGSVPSDLREKIAVVDNICMTADEKVLAQAYLPITDEGGMRFPRREFFSLSQGV